MLPKGQFRRCHYSLHLTHLESLDVEEDQSCQEGRVENLLVLNLFAPVGLVLEFREHTLELGGVGLWVSFGEDEVERIEEIGSGGDVDPDHLLQIQGGQTDVEIAHTRCNHQTKGVQVGSKVLVEHIVVVELHSLWGG